MLVTVMSGRWQHHWAAGTLSPAKSSRLEVYVIVDSWRHPGRPAAGASAGHQQRRRHDNRWRHQCYFRRGEQFAELTGSRVSTRWHII